MFQGLRCVAVFDWEMAALANAESDLGWWCFMQRFHTKGMGGPLPEGLLDRDETIALWEEKVGRAAPHVDFYELLGGFHFCLIMVMMGRNMERLMPGFPKDFGLTNPGVGVLEGMLV
jgi:aminoglycoside phosphotransferase (APT) family kinase protein